MNPETIDWKPVSEPPDDDMTVMIYNEHASEPVWLGYLDGENWRFADGMIAHPTHWAHVPHGPHQSASASTPRGFEDMERAA